MLGSNSHAFAVVRVAAKRTVSGKAFEYQALFLPMNASAPFEDHYAIW